MIEMYSTGYKVDGDSNSAVVNLYLKEQNNPAGFSYMVAVTGGTLISIDPSYSNVRFVTNANNYTSVGPCTDRF
ncbi:hypothetical protein HK103_001323 [Boothiomyces macroporosus]|uniref:Uncharacterized protein n=1 Tax=Boothiomyces macroporosus TaxID=261099 RepID=A0AAD5UBG1_9FUNG|nr:hypothetical protein HK103_001323 [Boothiomyces macroporosus]